MISVIIPTFNRKKLLKQAIDSILAQKKSKIEIIIVDDASDDGTNELIARMNDQRIKYIRNDKNIFAHECRKIGYRAATGNYVIFMDDDDYYTDSLFFHKAEEAFSANKTISIVVGGTKSIENNRVTSEVDLGGNGLIRLKDYLNGFGTKYAKPASTLTAVLRKDTLDNNNFENFRMINDTCIYLFAAKEGDAFLLNTPEAAYRIHSNNISKKRFKIPFIIDCLEGKKEIYSKIEQNTLKQPAEWFSNQICQSAAYFISSSDKSIITIASIATWIIFRGGKAKKLMFEELLKKAKEQSH